MRGRVHIRCAPAGEPLASKWPTDPRSGLESGARDVACAIGSARRAGTRRLGLAICALLALVPAPGPASAGTPGSHGPRLVRDVATEWCPSIKVSQPVAVVGETLLYAAYDGDRGNEPWRTDGTPAGTV